MKNSTFPLLTESEKAMLIERALAARENAYAPYSRFAVGAALLDADGNLYQGCNLENGSYSMTICAERSAICSAVASGSRQFRAIAIIGGRTEAEAKTKPCPPCGACLQVLSEFCPGEFCILLADGAHRLQDFMPSPFQL